MGRKRKSKISFKLFDHLDPETVHIIWGIIFLVLAVVFFMASIDKAGMVGEYIYDFFDTLIGYGYFLLPLMSILLSIVFFKSMKKEMTLGQILGSFLFFISGLGLVDIFTKNGGGVVGNLISAPLLRMLDLYATVVILFAVVVISFIVMFNMSFKFNFGFIFEWLEKRRALKEEQRNRKIAEEVNDEKIDKQIAEQTASAENDTEEEPEENEEKKKTPLVKKFFDKKESDEDVVPITPNPTLKPFSAPPLSLLARDKGKPGVGDIKANANIIKRTLQNFGIDVEMDEISVGPSVTRYALKPAEGVKISRIVGLQNDLSLALAAHPLRIEAPIPGKSLVGIEIPNSTKTTVGLATLLGSKEAKASDKPLLVGLGKGISGQSHFANLGKMPHLLIAGATGSGKSVTIHTLVTSLLYRNSPENLRFMMIDPKRVELTLYNKVPHQLTPVITDAKKAILGLKWAVKEMDRRYDVLESESVRDIDSYHKNVYEPELKKVQRKDASEEAIENLPESMPYIVIIIDELADIMQTYPRELEAAIVRLAQMSRAVGIHLILSTQRPSVNVITGLIKANVPARIALQVASQVDSRTILDAGGAEKLLGAGDMLYLSGEMSKPTRIQSAFISEEEVKKVVNYINDQYNDEIPDEIDFTATQNDNSVFNASIGDDNEEEDELYGEALETVVEAGKASTSYLQRKLRVGYARAARLMDMLEENGVIGPADGSKPRDIIIDQETSDPEAEPESNDSQTTKQAENEN